VSKTSEPPNPRWLVAYDNYDDEDVAESKLGRVVGRMEEDPSFEGEEAGSPEGEILEDAAAADMENVATAEASGTRKKRSSSQTGSTTSKTSPGVSNGNGSSSAEENATNKFPDSKRKKKGVTFTTSRSRSNSEVSSSLGAKEDAANSLANMAADMASKVSDREQRSRRRQAQTHEEAMQAFESPSKSGSNKRPPPGPNTNKISSGGGSKIKKAKPVPTEGEVLKVKLLTGTLFLYKGLHRHVEFIPKV
jgi:hypothetical protein